MDLSQMDISLSEISFSTADFRSRSEDDRGPAPSQPSILIRAAVSLTGTVNRFSLNMRTQLVISIDMDPELIADYENTFVNIIDSCLGLYYRSLRIWLSQMFGDTLNLRPVIGDCNCLDRSLSHIIFGTEKHYDDLKSKLITKFRNRPEHTLNVMHMSGITSEEELDDHFPLINIPNEWGTNVELAILGALAHLDILVIKCN